jgi:LysM repeat protein
MRRPVFWIFVVILSLGTLAGILVSAQDDETPDNTIQLPITQDVRYEVGVGDTLDELAAIFDVSVLCLRESNNITNENRILVGDQLLIRVACPPYDGLDYVPFPRLIEQGGNSNTYTVRVADTLSDIAFAFDISVESLQEFNGIVDPRQIFVGQVLEIPPGAPPFGRVPPFDDGTLEQGGGEGDIVYVIQPRDTLDVIGAFYNASPDCIAETNGIPNPNRITPRQTIIISEACAPYVAPNTPSGRIIAFEGRPTAAPTVVVTVTPRGEAFATATFPPPDAPQQTAVPTQEIVPTQEVIEQATVEPTQEVIPTNVPTQELTPVATNVFGTGGAATPTPEVLEPGNLLEELEDLSDGN